MIVQIGPASFRRGSGSPCLSVILVIDEWHDFSSPPLSRQLARPTTFLIKTLWGLLALRRQGKLLSRAVSLSRTSAALYLYLLLYPTPRLLLAFSARTRGEHRLRYPPACGGCDSLPHNQNILFLHLFILLAASPTRLPAILLALQVPPTSHASTRRRYGILVFLWATEVVLHLPPASLIMPASVLFSRLLLLGNLFYCGSALDCVLTQCSAWALIQRQHHLRGSQPVRD